MAGEVCRAFENANVDSPEDVKKLWDTYTMQMKAEGKQVSVGNGGFSGCGFRYDDAEDEAEANKRKMTKLVHGMETMDDDDEDFDSQLVRLYFDYLKLYFK